MPSSGRRRIKPFDGGLRVLARDYSVPSVLSMMHVNPGPTSRGPFVVERMGLPTVKDDADPLKGQARTAA
jgi:hypothetical protein